MGLGARSKPGLLAALFLVTLGAAPSLVSAQTTPKGDAAHQASASKLPHGVERVESIEGITEYRLQNGLRVLIFPGQTKEAITVNITYLVGSRHESYGETGMAHLLEHMLFKGTPKHRDIRKELKERGAAANATTFYDRTNYFEVFAATDENLEWALELEADRMVNSFVAKKDLDAEMTVVRNEMEHKENDPGVMLVQRMLATAFEWHNYGKSVIGARSDVENVPIEKLQAFYRTYYRPDNAVLIVTGKVAEQRVIELAHKHFGPIPRPQNALPRHYTVEPAQDGERLVTLRRVADFQLAMIGYHAPPPSHPDFAAVAVAVNTLVHNPTGRLHKGLVEAKKASAAAGFAVELRERSYLIFNAMLRKGDSLADARDALEKAVASMIADPPTKEEVDSARMRFLNAFEAGLRNPMSVANDLSDAVAAGDWRLMFLVRDRIREVTVEDVKRVAAAYLKPSNRTVGLFVPAETVDRTEIPVVSDEQIAAMLQGYKGGKAVADGEALDPSHASIEARTLRSKIGNLNVALLPKKTRGNTVVLRLSLRMGDEKSLMHRDYAGAMAAAMLERGTTKRTRKQIADEYDRLKAQGSIGGSETSVGADFQTTRENLPALMRLIAEVLREPSFPADELEQLRQQTLTSLESSRSDPGSIAANAVSRHLNIRPKGHVYYAATFEERIAAFKAVTLADVKAFHRDFYGASHGQLTIVGDFDPAEMAALAKELFGSWKSKTPYVRVASKYAEYTVVNKSFETPDKANAIFYAYQPLKILNEDPDYAALLIATNVLASGTKSRLFERLRSKEGLSYSAGGELSAGTLDPVGSFSANAIYAPQNVGRVEAAFKEEIARSLKDGITAEELESARKGLLESWKVGRSDDVSLSQIIHSWLAFDRTLAWLANLEERIKAVTVADANRALRRFIDLDRMIIVKAGDFANAKRPDVAPALR
jgi:zinc protease